MVVDKVIDIDKQIELMEKYIVVTKKDELEEMLKYVGYYRLSRYGKYSFSYREKSSQELLYNLYDFDTELRKLFFLYCKKSELQIKSNISNAVSLKVNDSTFYLKDDFYSQTKSEHSKIKRKINKARYPEFIRSVGKAQEKLKENKKINPELSKYKKNGKLHNEQIPSWVCFYFFEFGLITNIYEHLRLDLKKCVLIYGYSRKNYSKTIIKSMDTWLKAIRNLRNFCSHHNKLIGISSSIVLLDNEDEDDILTSKTDLFSRIYALKKVLNYKDGENLKNDLKKVIDNANFNIYDFKILPEDWENKFDRIKKL